MKIRNIKQQKRCPWKGGLDQGFQNFSTPWPPYSIGISLGTAFEKQHKKLHKKLLVPNLELGNPKEIPHAKKKKDEVTPSLILGLGLVLGLGLGIEVRVGVRVRVSVRFGVGLG